ncbi:hypothetical protein AB6A40_010710 [Gnathostoma spinigerum]|uniref:E3 ubiquitin-protein ligase hrd-1 n=1 Tax=Gnathostoma spinigerum TaxID=75299 RepID=A0ABD6EXD2_9BILA
MLYMVFVGVMIRLHTFPLFSIRPLYLTVRAFHKAVNDVILSRRAIHAMNNLFPLATEEDLAQGDNTCIICREEMTPMSGAKKLPCNHIFHSNCLRSWFQRQQSCPTCRTDILAQRRPATTAPRPAAGVNEAPQAAVPGQPNVGDVPPNLFPFMAHHFGFPPPPPQNNDANSSAAPNQAAAGTATSTANSPSSSTGVPQFPLPPPGMPFMPPPPFMMMAPPMPFPLPTPPTFVGLSDAEVAAMEGQERAAVEARVNCLRNIAILLDAATMQLQQYSSIVQTLSLQQTQSSNVASVPSEKQQHTSADMPSTSTAQPSTSSVSTSKSEEQTRVDNDGVSASEEQQASKLAKNDAPEGSSPDPYLSEIRQRRLAKLAGENVTNKENNVQS